MLAAAGCRGEPNLDPYTRPVSTPFVGRTGYWVLGPTSARQVIITTESPRWAYQYGRPVPVRMSVTNNSDTPFILDTAGMPLEEIQPSTPAGLEEPRPVYDLVFVGQAYQGGGVWRDEVWLWSRTSPDQPPTRLMLAPHESRVLIDTVWYPSVAGSDFGMGKFTFRLGQMEHETRILIGFEGKK